MSAAGGGAESASGGLRQLGDKLGTGLGYEAPVCLDGRFYKRGQNCWSVDHAGKPCGGEGLVNK